MDWPGITTTRRIIARSGNLTASKDGKMNSRKILLGFACLAACVSLAGCNLPANRADATKTAQANEAQSVLQTAMANASAAMTQAAASGKPTLAPVAATTAAPVVIPTLGATQKPIPSDPGTDNAALAGETVPDGTKYTPGATFTKTWRMMNTGTSTWTNSYKLIFVDGDQMEATKEFYIPVPVEPGKIIDMSVQMKAPDTEGTYKGYWKIKNPNEKTFGPGGTGSFWVQIVVAVPTPTATAIPLTATATSEPTTTAETPTASS